MSSLIIVISPTDNPDPSLQHWPAVAAWWSSRACIQGPASELCDVVCFPSAKPVVFIWSTPHGQAPLSWQLCVWSFLVSTLCSSTGTVCQSRSSKLKIYGRKHSVYSIVGWARGLNSDQLDQSTQPKPKEQGVILVTEHNAEVNAGFAVLRGSNHAPPLLEEDWQSIPLGSGESHNLAIRKYRQKLVSDYWKLVSTMVWHGRDDRDMTPSECQAWIQTLALTPFCGHVINTSLEWAVAWSLVGEWNTRTIFLPPKEEWPRQGHPQTSYRRMISGPSPCSRGLELVSNKIFFARGCLG